MFSGVNYQFWKVRMKIFIESIDRGIWNAIVNGPFIPMHVVDDVSTAKCFDELTDLENKKMQICENFSKFNSPTLLNSV